MGNISCRHEKRQKKADLIAQAGFSFSRLNQSTTVYIDANGTRIGDFHFTTDIADGIATAEIALFAQNDTSAALAKFISHSHVP